MDTNDINVINNNREQWLLNVRANRRHFVRKSPDIKGMVVFIVGAGPSLKKNVEHLKLIPKNGRGLIVACDVSLPYLYDNDITPDICFSLDSKDTIWKMINTRNINTEDITLICGVMSSPLLTDSWKGPKQFYLQKGIGYAEQMAYDLYMNTRIFKAKTDIRKDDNIGIENLDVIYKGILPSIITGGNVTAAAYSWSKTIFNAWKIVFVGSDFSWVEDKEFYIDGQFKAQGKQQIINNETMNHIDINGLNVYTNKTLLKFKNWHEEFSTLYPNTTINSTEGGIFGVNEEGLKVINSIDFMNLESAIKKYVL